MGKQWYGTIMSLLIGGYSNGQEEHGYGVPDEWRLG